MSSGQEALSSEEAGLAVMKILISRTALSEQEGVGYPPSGPRARAEQVAVIGNTWDVAVKSHRASKVPFLKKMKGRWIICTLLYA